MEHFKESGYIHQRVGLPLSSFMDIWCHTSAVKAYYSVTILSWQLWQIFAYSTKLLFVLCDIYFTTWKHLSIWAASLVMRHSGYSHYNVLTHEAIFPGLSFDALRIQSTYLALRHSLESKWTWVLFTPEFLLQQKCQETQMRVAQHMVWWMTTVK